MTIPSGAIAFYFDRKKQAIVYSVVYVTNRYADDITVIELPRGSADSIYVNLLSKRRTDFQALPRLAVEKGKENATVRALKIQDYGNWQESLYQAGYFHEMLETEQDTGVRELQEEHGFDIGRHAKMVRRYIDAPPFPVASTYGSKTEKRFFLEINGNIKEIQLAVSYKTESKSKPRLGVRYVEEGGWATLAEIKQNIYQFVEYAKNDEQRANTKMLQEAEYLKSIVDWLESAENNILLPSLNRAEQVRISGSPFRKAELDI